VHDEQWLKDARCVADDVPADDVLHRRGAQPVLPARRFAFLGGRVVVKCLLHRHRRRPVVRRSGDGRHVLHLARLELALARIGELPEILAKTRLAEKLDVGIGEVVTAGDQRHRRDPRVQSGNLEAIACAETHAAQREPGRIDIRPGAQIAHGVFQVLHLLIGIQVRARLTVGLAEVAVVEAQDGVPRVLERGGVVRERLLLDRRHRARHNDSGRGARGIGGGALVPSRAYSNCDGTPPPRRGRRSSERSA
jgi:hypothetical protein